MRARVLLAFEWLAISVGIRSPLVIDSKSNPLLVSCFSEKLLQFELAAFIQQGAKAKLTQKKLLQRSEIIGCLSNITFLRVVTVIPSIGTAIWHDFWLGNHIEIFSSISNRTFLCFVSTQQRSVRVWQRDVLLCCLCNRIFQPEFRIIHTTSVSHLESAQASGRCASFCFFTAMGWTASKQISFQTAETAMLPSFAIQSPISKRHRYNSHESETGLGRRLSWLAPAAAHPCV